MPPRTEIFDLGRLGLASGEGRRLDLEVPVDGFEFGGQGYAVPAGPVEAALDISHTTNGYSLRLRFEATLSGPCMRCLEEAGHAVEVDAREIDQPGGGEDLRSPYLEEGQLDVKAWARDALALALPTQIVCREDAWACARYAARTSTRPALTTRTSPNPIRAGPRCGS